FVSADNTRILADNLSSPIPDEDVNITLYQNPSIKEEFYGGVIVEKSPKGWIVSGYDVLNGRFLSFPANVTGKKVKVTIGKYEVSECLTFNENKVVSIPYGTEFRT